MTQRKSMKDNDKKVFYKFICCGCKECIRSGELLFRPLLTSTDDNATFTSGIRHIIEDFLNSCYSRILSQYILIC